ncbi:hypothetical protein [Lentibacillus salicampi]|uniref:Uncharacterized protein n=1 Tax=Lentibacillus salicampi TaxID=175306 RepID=A0A4Y9ACL8_9BACI|nr:hypothetical protein [Lentibacillus salicampi]TFJ92660.1 hypothetical protein E4U82_10920 [Lentibacillus salicampi]
MSKLNKFFYDYLGMENKNLDELTIYNLGLGMKKEKFPEKLIADILGEFNKIINELGEKKFQEWLFNLHFQIPDPFKNELRAEDIYNNYENWIEREIVNLENETNLSWEKQSEDIANVNMKIRKTQLVLRHRISEVVLDLLN